MQRLREILKVGMTERETKLFYLGVGIGLLDAFIGLLIINFILKR